MPILLYRGSHPNRGIKEPAMTTSEKIEHGGTSQNGTQLRYAGVLDGIKARIDDVNKQFITPITLMGWVNSSIDVTELNSLDESYDYMRSQVALAMRALSVTVWNVYQDVNTAIGIIIKADTIRVDAQTEGVVREARYQISEIKRKLSSGQPITTSSAYNTPSGEPAKKHTEFGSGVILVVIILIAITVAVFVSMNSTPQTSAATMYYKGTSSK